MQPKRNHAQQSAIALLQKFDFIKPPIPVEKIAAHLGAKVSYSPLDDELSGMICIKDGTPIIGINSLHNSNRQRFTLAHEIAHLSLHRNQLDNQIHVDKGTALMRNSLSAKGTDKSEVEANQFAAVLLMPRNLVVEAMREATGDYEDDSIFEELAEKFKVSRSAMEYRVKDILAELYVNKKKSA